MRFGKFVTQQLGVSCAITGCEIRSDRVTVDSETVRNAAFKPPPEHDIAYDGSPLMQQHGPRYFMPNESQGYVCSTDDPGHLTVLYFLDEPVAWKLHAAGYPNIDITDLVLMIDDGQWSHCIISPRHHCEKTYLVALELPAAGDTAEQSAKDVQLYNEKDLTKPAVLGVITPTQARPTISEGCYHQMKHMFAIMSNHVAELHREHVGGITLDADLAPGEYRPSIGEEIASVI